MAGRSFKLVAAPASRIVPPEGGNTDFATERAAYDGLSAERKAALENLTALHRMTYRDMANDKGYNEEDKKRHVVTHPLVRANPVNGRKALYVGHTRRRSSACRRKKAPSCSTN